MEVRRDGGMDGGTEARTDGGTEVRRDGGTEGRRDGGTEGRMDGGTEGRRSPLKGCENPGISGSENVRTQVDK